MPKNHNITFNKINSTSTLINNSQCVQILLSNTKDNVWLNVHNLTIIK